MKKSTLLATLSLVAVLSLGSQASAELVFNGEFNIYKPGTNYTVLGTLDGPGVFDTYAQGVGDGVGLNGAVKTATWADGSGTSEPGGPVDLPGWVSVNGGNPDTGKNGVDGSNGLNIFAGWGGQQRIETDPAVGTVAVGNIYTIEAQIDGHAGGPIEGGLEFHLMANGIELTADAPIPAFVGGMGFQTFSRTYDLSTLPEGVNADDPLTIILGVSDTNTNGGRMIWDNIELITETSFLPTDFNQDGNSDLVDLDALTGVTNLTLGLPVALSDPKYDLTGDEMINGADLDQWLTDAATVNGFGSPYLKGDANLDGDCDVFAIDGSGDAQILSSNLGTAADAVWSDGDFNGDGDVDVFAIDGSGDAQLLSSNLGSSSDATAGTAEAIYNAITGELSFDVGEGVAVIGVQAEGLDHEAVDAGSNLGAPAQNGGGILAYFDAAGLKVGMADVGAVLPAGLAAEDIGFSFTPIGGDSTVVPVTVIVPEPSTIAMLLVLGAVALCLRRRIA